MAETTLRIAPSRTRLREVYTAISDGKVIVLLEPVALALWRERAPPEQWQTELGYAYDVNAEELDDEISELTVELGEQGVLFIQAARAYTAELRRARSFVIQQLIGSKIVTAQQIAHIIEQTVTSLNRSNPLRGVLQLLRQEFSKLQA